MKKLKKVNRKVLVSAIRNILSNERVAVITKTRAASDIAMEMDERIIKLRSLIEVEPLLAAELEKAITNIMASASYEAAKNLKGSWIGADEVDIMEARLELMTDDELRAYTIEKLADVVKDK